MAVTIIPESAIETWRLNHFNTVDNAGLAADSADPDSDGEVNLLEFATGQNPHAASIANVLLVPATGSLFQFTYPRSKAAFDGGYRFEVEYSDSLDTSSWIPVGTGSVISDAPLQTVRATIPAGSEGRCFVRLRVQSP